MAFSFKIDKKNNLVTVVCDNTTPSSERVKIIDELVEILVKNPSLKIFLDVSQIDTESLENDERPFCDLFLEKNTIFGKSKVAIYAGHKKAYVRPKLFNAFAFVQTFKNFALFDNKNIASQWLKDSTR